MSRLITGLLTWFGLSVIITEVVNNFSSLDFRLKVHFVAIPVLLIFLLSELVINNFQNKANSSAVGKNKHQRIITVYNLFLGLDGLIFLLSIPFLWWGVIKKLSMIANEGKKVF
jgi:hypothetical protein